MLKVLHINTSDKGGGAETFAFDFVHCCHETYNTLIVKSKNTDSEKVIEIPKWLSDKMVLFIEKILYKLGERRSLKNLFFLNESFNFTYDKLSKLKIYQDADIIHLHNIHGGYFDLNAIEKIAKTKPIVWTLHDMWAMTGGEAYVFDNENYKKGIGKTPYEKFYPLNSPWLDRRQYYLNRKKELYKKNAEAITFVMDSEWQKNCFVSSYVFNEHLNISTIYCGISPKEFFDHQKRNWEIPRVLIVNNNNPFKGAHIFNQVFPYLNADIELYVIGDKLKFDTKNIKKIIYLPYFDNKRDLNRIFNEVDILIFPSVAENFPLTVISAMMSGVCVIASKTGGISEQLEPCNGILFAPNNPKDLIAKLTHALANIKETRNIGKIASTYARKMFNDQLMYSLYLQIYRKSIERFNKSSAES